MEWKKIDPFGDFEAGGHDEFLLMDEYSHVYIGFTPFDYYEASYWSPLPRMPYKCVITNEACIPKLLKE